MKTETNTHQSDTQSLSIWNRGLSLMAVDLDSYEMRPDWIAELLLKIIRASGAAIPGWNVAKILISDHRIDPGLASWVGMLCDVLYHNAICQKDLVWKKDLVEALQADEWPSAFEVYAAMRKLDEFETAPPCFGGADQNPVGGVGYSDECEQCKRCQRQQECIEASGDIHPPIRFLDDQANEA